MTLISKVTIFSVLFITVVIFIGVVDIFTRIEFSGVADKLYDDAFVGVHYAHKVEVNFVRFELSHKDSPPPYVGADDAKALRLILEDLDVAIERAPGETPKVLATEARASINRLMDPRSQGAAAPPLQAIDERLTKLVQSYADAALDMRTDVDDRVEKSAKNLTIILGLIIVFGVGGAALLVFNIGPPLRRLAKMIDDNEDFSEFSADQLLTRSDEIGAVARSQSRWRDRLQESINQLEDRVRERTLELEQARDQADEANVAKTAFLANVSHEIRTPLNGILGMTQALSREKLAPQHRSRLDIIRTSGEALLAVLNDVLDLSKIEAGKMDIEAIEFDLPKLVETVHAHFGHMAAAKDLQLSVDAHAAQGVYRSDPLRIRQILFNLISNALKFTQTGGIAVTITRRDAEVRFVVRDTGIGMPPAVLGKIFTKFSQADPTTTRRFGGTGLGLSICRQLVEMMGGRIAAVSEEGVGSTFTVDLPMAWVAASCEHAAARDADPDGTAPSGNWRVLAAEDNDINQLVLMTLLNQVGIEPTIVQNGCEAVAAWRSGKFDLILMDIQMPEMDGAAATRAIRREEAVLGRSRTPIVALTANVMAHQTEQYGAAGMDGHLAKPIDVRDLFACLTRFLGGGDNPHASQLAG